MSSNIFFQPFVGNDYANGGIFGKRIMILGESHYCDEEMCGLWRLPSASGVYELYAAGA